MKNVIVGLVAVAAVGFSVMGVSAKSAKPAATLELSGGSLAAGAGVSWGHGALTYRGKKYPIDAEGFDVGEVGVTTLSASGKVYIYAKDRAPWDEITDALPRFDGDVPADTDVQ